MSSPSPSPSPPPAPTERQKRRFQALQSFKPRSDPAARNNATKFPLDGVSLDTVSEETLVSLIDTAPVLHQFGGTTIVRVSRDLVFKGGRHVPPSEAMSMQLAAGKVRLPKVHTSFDAVVRAYILMEYIDGTKLSDVWDSLPQDKKASVARQVADMIKAMQAIELDTPGPVGGGKAVGKLFPDCGAGPFEDRKALEAWFNSKLASSKEAGQAADTPEFSFPKLVLTHMSISPQNIILTQKGEVYLLNWDCAGGYPPVFERAALDGSFADFHSLVSALLPDQSKDLAQLESIDSLLKAPSLNLR